MKKFLFIFISIIALFITVIGFNSINAKELENILNIEVKDATIRVLMPSELENENPEEILKTLENLLKTFNGNLFINRFNNDTKTYKKYIYLSDNKLLKDLNITTGRLLNNADNLTANYLSTKNNHDKAQIGEIRDFAGDDIIEFHTLKSYINDKGRFNENIIFTFPPNTDTDEFIKNLNKELNIDVKAVQPTPNLIERITPYFIIIILYVIGLFLMLFTILGSYKEIAIEKLHGATSKEIWLKKIGEILLAQFIIFSITSLCTSLFLFKEYNLSLINFLFKLTLYNLFFIIISFAIFSIPFIFIENIKISHMLKNKKAIKEIILLNNFIKVILTIILITLSVNAIENYKSTKLFYDDSLKMWEHTKDYVAIPGLTSLSGEYLMSDEFIAINKKLYKKFNKDGSILANFNNVNESYLTLNNLPLGHIDNYISVNPNYLKLNKIYDIKGNEINISEEDKRFILLVPEKYKNKENEIINSYTQLKNSLFENENSELKNKPIQILWTKNNQEIFSYRTDINPQGNNKIINPIVRVITESNGSIYDYDFLGVIGNPLKIKIPHGISKDTYIKEILKEFSLNEHIERISSIYDLVSYDIEYIKTIIKISLITIIIINAALITLIIENILNYFFQNKKRLAIETFNGYKKRDKYLDYFKWVCISWILIISITLFISKSNLMKNFYIIPIIIFVELIISLVTIRFIEKHKILSVIKGE